MIRHYHKSLIFCATFFSLVLLLTFAACEKADPTDPVGVEVKKGIAPQPDAEVAVIENANPAFGKIVIELYPNLAPKMVERFKTLSKQGFYNGVAWHRVNVKSGVIQTGDPNSKNDTEVPLPSEALPGNLPAEFSDILYERGIVGAARRSPGGGLSERDAYDTANSQWFVTLKRVTTWDKKYTIFGKVIQGLNNADIIAGAPVEPGTERPAPKIIIKSITLEPRSNYVK